MPKNKFLICWPRQEKKTLVDWKTLSPNEPPLPFFLSSRSTPTLKTTSSRTLYTIPELSDMNTTIDECESDVEFIPICQWPLYLQEPEFDPGLVGNESLCKKIFYQLLCHQRSASSSEVKQMQLMFSDGNIEGVRIELSDDTIQDYLGFGGSTQYIPPELSTSSTYYSELADVWSLGISLYKMLIGKYPFTYTTDTELFDKMKKSDFGMVPYHGLSLEVKDLLCRMLTPHPQARASIDLIYYHPWLKSVVIEQPVEEQHTEEEKVIPRKKKKKLIQRIMMLIIKGPYHPP